ncbi:MAG: hypothetical protein B6D46_02530 [Polyangiaceae bacterium UTPRO1]|nr:MAG: hypothetical protein B6D46_02530 [Polyangiaceae bacterium UTPRO1]
MGLGDGSYKHRIDPRPHPAAAPMSAPMKIQLHDILASEDALDYAEPVEALNATLASGNHDYEFRAPLHVQVRYSRSQLDLFFDGEVSGRAEATCGRCLEPFPLAVSQAFSLVLTPATRLSGEIELAPGDLVQSFYEGTEVDLTPLVYEQVMLALPTRPLCGEECRGLCPQCGSNRNVGHCACTIETGDPRWSTLRNLKIYRGA